MKPADPPTGGDRLLTPREVAERFGVRTKTLTGWARRGEIPHVMTLGGHRRYRERDVEALVARLATKTQESVEPGNLVPEVPIAE